VQLQQFGSPHETLSAERHHVGVRGAPRRHRIGPLLGSPLIEQIVTGAEHAAVDDAGHDRSHFSGRDGHHHFVEAGHAGGGLLLPEHGAPFGVAGQGGQIGVPQPLADRAGIREVGLRARHVTLARLPAAAQAQEEPTCHGISGVAGEQTLGAGQPAADFSLTMLLFRDRQQPPQGGCGGAPAVAAIEEALERPGARGGAGVVEADQPRGRRQPIEILGVERRRAIGLREGRIRFGPVLTVVRLASALQRVFHPVRTF
jgi:hypothetical protein